MDSIFKEHSQKIHLYFARETQSDPFEKNVSLTYTHSVVIDAIVTDLTTSQAQWKIAGIYTDKAKDILIEKKYRLSLEACAKIKIGTEYYEGWRHNGKLQYREEGDYLRVYVYIKKAE